MSERMGLWSAALLAAALLAASPAQAGDVFAGRQVYREHCVNCHGVEGNPTVVGTPSFVYGERLRVPDPVLIAAIKSGRNLMPAYGRVITEAGILDVVAYIRTLSRR